MNYVEILNKLLYNSPKCEVTTKSIKTNDLNKLCYVFHKNNLINCRTTFIYIYIKS